MIFRGRHLGCISVTWLFERTRWDVGRIKAARINAFTTDFSATLKRSPRVLKAALAAMLVIDVIFIIISASEDVRGFQDHHISFDIGHAEQFQYVKWAILLVTLGYVSIAARSLMHCAWAVLFLYLLIDDSQQLHETFGKQLAQAWGLRPMLGLRAQDFGELAVTAIATVPLACLIAAAYSFSDRNARRFCHTAGLLLVALAFFGIVMDMIEIIVPWARLRQVCGLIEDGGEMIVASLIVAYCVGNSLGAGARSMSVD